MGSLGMAEATEMVTGINSLIWIPVYVVLIVSLLFWSSYRHIARVFKWLTLVLFAYVGAAFLAQPDWTAVIRSTFIPHIEWSRAYLASYGDHHFAVFIFLAGLTGGRAGTCNGTLIGSATRSNGQRIEEFARRYHHRNVVLESCDVYFIILTTAATLNAHGQTSITTARRAAEALKPLAGNGAYWLFTLGLIGTGMLGVPVLAGSCAYAVAEAGACRGSLEQRPRLAPRFYIVIAVSMLVGLALDYMGINAVAMLFWSAVLNGLLAPPLIAIVILLTSNPKVMGKRTNSLLLQLLGWTTVVVMTCAAAAMIGTAR
jgi:Mn2+/Fe2+ NRAMP family transporter